MQWLNRSKRLCSRLSPLVPTLCVVCLRQSDTDFNLCTTCIAQLPSLQDCCSRCGLPVATTSYAAQRDLAHELRCGSCLGKAFALTSCRAVCHYSRPIDALLGQFKFTGRLDIGYSLSRLLAGAMELYYESLKCPTRPDLLIPVPIHPRRYLQRGFNQAWELTKVVGRHTGIRVSNDLVRKSRPTEPQSNMPSASARKLNLRGAFRINPRFPLKDVTRITIIDDVVTTMSTATAIARLLQRHGISEVAVWSVARASLMPPSS